MTRACREARTRCTSWDISRAPEPVRAIYDHGPPAEPSVRPAVAPETMLAFALGTRGAHARAGRWPAWRTDGHAGERRRHIALVVAPDFSSIGGRTPGSEPVLEILESLETVSASNDLSRVVSTEESVWAFSHFF